jgi:hypothetical protein
MKSTSFFCIQNAPPLVVSELQRFVKWDRCSIMNKINAELPYRCAFRSVKTQMDSPQLI